MAKQSKQALQEKLAAQQNVLRRRAERKLRLINNWWVFVVGIFVVYIGLPFAAPTLMRVGATGPANAIYTGYSLTCHQFAFRSLFLYGDQAFYPRQVAEGKGNLTAFEVYAAKSQKFRNIYTDEKRDTLRREGHQAEAAAYVFNPDDLKTFDTTLQAAARRFRGDDEMGYKVAICQRDIMIYVGLVVGGIAYGPVRRRIRPCPLWLYLLLGVAPIALDGFSQLLSYPFPLISSKGLWEVRETAPAFRLLTGALFGLMSAWLAFPYLNMSAEESIRRIESDLDALDQEAQQLIKKV
ncbi:MAG: DUF2085 domain-containing protein [Chloroflexi bacterium]|nr:DUF2085 domain-containing protein [Chloroflexota bacterium]